MKNELDTELFRTIKSMDTKKLNQEDKLELLNIFNFTKNAAIRDQIALIFAETRYNEAIPFIVKKIKEKDLYIIMGRLCIR